MQQAEKVALNSRDQAAKTQGWSCWAYDWMKLSESSDCECSTAIQTIQHIIIINCPNKKNQKETMYNQLIDYIYTMQCTPVSERKLDLNVLLWPTRSSPLTARAVT